VPGRGAFEGVAGGWGRLPAGVVALGVAGVPPWVRADLLV
jgi:hypothetical protein